MKQKIISFDIFYPLNFHERERKNTEKVRSSKQYFYGLKINQINFKMKFMMYKIQLMKNINIYLLFSNI